MICFEQAPVCIKVEPSAPISDPATPKKADRLAVVNGALHHRVGSIGSPSTCAYGDTGMPKFDAVRSRDRGDCSAGDASPARKALCSITPYEDTGMPNDDSV